MRTDFVVAIDPAIRDFPDLRNRIEQIRIQHLLPVGPVEALDEGVLIRLARLDGEGARGQGQVLKYQFSRVIVSSA
jgi:hypothetical protein